MMSENSSFSNFIVLQKNITKRRRWLVILAFVTFILYNVGVLVLALNSDRNSNVQDLVKVMISDAKGFLGISGLNRVITMVGSVMLGIEGFRWLSNRQMIDFYESQPFSKTAHFVGVTVNSALILFLSHLAGTLLGIISLAAVFRVFDVSVLKAAFVCLGIDVTIFLAVFSVTALAVMLTGNLLVSVIAAVVLLVYEPVFKLGVNSSLSQLSTFAGDSLSYKGIFSTIIGVVAATKYIWVAGNLICAAVTMALAFILYRYRKNEDAGKTVPLKPVRIVTKIAVIFLAAIMTGSVFLVDEPFSSQIISMIVSAVVIGGIMEAIYNSDVRKIFKGLGYTAIGGALAIVLLLSCHYDLFGYNHWVPDKNDVDSAAISRNFDAKSMKLTDIDTVNALLKAGEDNVDQGDDMLLDLNISYRMKNGSLKRRYVIIPDTTETKELMNKIITSDEFKHGYFKVYRDKDIEENLSEVTITYKNFGDNPKSKAASASDIYEGLKAAYKKDLVNYDFETAGYKCEIGNINLYVPGKGNKSGYDNSLPVYKSFTNTIAFLKAHDMYVEPAELNDESGLYSGPFYVDPSTTSY